MAFAPELRSYSDSNRPTWPGESASRMGNEDGNEAMAPPGGPSRAPAWLAVGAGLLLMTLVDALFFLPASPAPGLPALLALATPFLLSAWWLVRALAPLQDAPVRVIFSLMAFVLVGLVAWPAAQWLAQPAAAIGTAVVVAGLGLGLVGSIRIPGRDAALRTLGAMQLGLAILAGISMLSSSSPHDLSLASSAGVAHAVLGLHWLSTGLRGQPQRMMRLSTAFLAGLSLLVLAGWASGSAAIVQGGTRYVPMQFNTALGCLLAAISLGLLGAGRRRQAQVPLVPVLVLAFASLAEEYLGLALGVGEWLVAHHIVAEDVVPGRMAPNTATAFLITALGIALAPRAGQKAPSRWAATWACGFMVAVIGAVVLAGYLIDVPVVRAWGTHTPMAMLTGLAMLVMGLALAFAGTGPGVGQRQRGVWLPLVVAVAVTLISLAVWYGISRDQERRDEAALVAQMDAVEHALLEGSAIRASALERMAARLARAPDQATREA